MTALDIAILNLAILLWEIITVHALQETLHLSAFIETVRHIFRSVAILPITLLF